MPELLKACVKQQLGAALVTLRRVVEACPDDLWNREGDDPPFWRAAYHATYSADFYLRESEAAFEPRDYHDENLVDLDSTEGGPVTRQQVLDYIAWCEPYLVRTIDELPGEALAAPSPFWWLRMSRAESLLFNMRHVQHHAAQLNDRLKRATGEAVDWVGRSEPA